METVHARVEDRHHLTLPGGPLAPCHRSLHQGHALLEVRADPAVLMHADDEAARQSLELARVQLHRHRRSPPSRARSETPAPAIRLRSRDSGEAMRPPSLGARKCRDHSHALLALGGRPDLSGTSDLVGCRCRQDRSQRGKHQRQRCEEETHQGSNSVQPCLSTETGIHHLTYCGKVQNNVLVTRKFVVMRAHWSRRGRGCTTPRWSNAF